MRIFSNVSWRERIQAARGRAIMFFSDHLNGDKMIMSLFDVRGWYSPSSRCILHTR